MCLKYKSKSFNFRGNPGPSDQNFSTALHKICDLSHICYTWFDEESVWSLTTKMAIWNNCQFVARRVPLAGTSAATYGEYVQTPTRHFPLFLLFQDFHQCCNFLDPCLQLPLQRRECSIVSGEISMRVPLIAPPPPPRHQCIIFERCLS